MKRVAFVILIGIVSVIVNWLALQIGWWWLTLIVGLLIGVLLRPASIGFLASLCAGGFGWGLPLAVLALNAPVKSTAHAVESVVGLSSTGGRLIIVLTIVLGCILSVIGTWVGVAGRQLPGTGRRLAS
jgi:small-conductance mechanosensitive channel